MDDNVGGWERFFVVIDNGAKELPLSGGHGALNQVVFGVYLARHDEA